eukprot:augustus_masked-scaffold_1-processed-gene-22.2-mRNA-1 protein AED:1.00 eAED:1.00 QI:0/0/0/0/1/1/2/0/208
MNNVVTNNKRAGNKVRALQKFCHLKGLNIFKGEAHRTKGWYEEEKHVLKALKLRFDRGNYEKYMEYPYLPSRSEQQLSSRIQKVMGLQAIGVFNGLNSSNRPSGIHLLKGNEKLLEQLNKEVAVDVKEIASIVVPYLHRLDNLENVKLLLDEFDGTQWKKFENATYTAKDKLMKMLEDFVESNVTVLKESKKEIESSNKFMLNLPEFF